MKVLPPHVHAKFNKEVNLMVSDFLGKWPKIEFHLPVLLTLPL